MSFFLCTASETTCTARFHLPCLANRFLAASASSSTITPPSAAPPSTRARPLLPTHGSCPVCQQSLHWSDLVRGSFRRKEETDGTRKKRRFEKGTRSKESALARGVDQLDEDDAQQGSGTQTHGRRKRAKGKANAIAIASDDGNSSAEGSSDMEGQERSWARSTAAEGALEEAAPSSQASEESEDGIQPTVSILPKQKTSRNAGERSNLAKNPTAQSSTTNSRRTRRPNANPPPLLASSFSSSKPGISGPASKKPHSKTNTRNATVLPAFEESDDSDELAHPSTLGIGFAIAGGQKKNARKQNKAEYVELSDD